MNCAATNNSIFSGFLASTHRAPLERNIRATTATNYAGVDFDESEATALNNENLGRTFVTDIKSASMAFNVGGSSINQNGGMLRIYNFAFEASGIIGSTQRAAQSAKHKIAKKLTELDSLFFEDYERKLSAESLEGLTEFLATLPSPEVPSLAAESSGAIVATWRKGNRSVSLKFLDETQFHYALSIEMPQGIYRPWGTSDRSAFFSKQPLARAIIEQAT